MTQDNRNQPQRPQPLDYRNEPAKSGWQQGLKILLWAAVIFVFSIALLIGVVAGACMCMR